MAAVATRRKARPKYESVADLLHALGGISPDRVAFDPWPGRATVRDVVRLNDRGPQLYELVDGVLVEKVMGQKESALASEVIADIMVFARQHNLGYVTGEAGTYRIAPGLVRAPDVAFTTWERLGGTTLSDDAAPKVAPDLAVEVLSPGNTRGEIARKLKEYFRAGVRIVWVIDPKKRAARSHTAPDEFITLTEADALDGGDVLPGFRLPLRSLFARLPKPAAKRAPKKKNGKGRV